MLRKCANPACPSLFRSLSHGKLFLLQTDRAGKPVRASSVRSRRARSVRKLERFWLCDSCSSLLTLVFERGRGMVTVPLPTSKTRVAVLHLKQARPTTKEYRALRT
jgi:hypothetical protein